MKVAKALEWLTPYVEAAKADLPKNKRLARLWTFKIQGRYGKSQVAGLFTDNHRSFRIYLHTKMYPRYAKEPMTLSKIDLLNNLAHELAHMWDMDHTPKHNFVEAKLKARFSKMLEKEGYVSEEEELKEVV